MLRYLCYSLKTENQKLKMSVSAKKQTCVLWTFYSFYCFHSYLTQYADSDNINYTLYYQFFKGIAMVPFKWADSSCLEKKQNWWPRTQTVITKERANTRRWSKEQNVVSQTMQWFSINNDMLIRYGWWARSRMHLLIKISFQFVF